MISVVLKMLLEIILEICIYETSLDSMTILVSHQAVPPTFYNKIAPMIASIEQTAHKSKRSPIFNV